MSADTNPVAGPHGRLQTGNVPPHLAKLVGLDRLAGGALQPQRAELLKLRKEQFALRLQRATGQPVKPDQFGKVRRNIARLKTAIRAGGEKR